MKKAFFHLLVLFAAGSLLHAGPVMPDFATVASGGWYVDRYAPAGFEYIPAILGRTDVLRIGIDVADSSDFRPAAYQGSFYNTQGRKYDLNHAGAGELAADLYIPASWADPALGLRRTDMWATMYDGGGGISGYPIIGFTNYSAAGEPAGGRYRIWQGGAWIDLAMPVLYGQWTSLRISFTGAGFEYYLNGALANAVSDPASAAIANVIMQAYNFGDDFGPNPNPSYDAYWANGVPEPSSWLLALAGVLAIRARRRITG